VDKKPKYNKETLGLLYNDAVAIDKKIFSEQKSNVLLYAGEHYAKPGSKFLNNIRDARNIDNNMKIRIVKNHIQKICKGYVNNILNAAPGVIPVPRQERELQHQKTAELNKATWDYINQACDLDEKIANFAHDFVVQGEVVCKIYWNPKLGNHVGYEQKLDDAGEPMFDDEDKMMPTKGRAVFTGFLDFERMYSFNFLRDPACRSIKDSPILGYQKMLSLEDSKALVNYDKEKIKLLQTGLSGADYVVFDVNDQRYVETKNQVLLVEWYVKPSADYPEGHYYLCTPQGDILEEMPLPFGIYPIIYEGFDELTSTPRHYSIIKVARPYQSHLNFLASKAVEHAVTLGDDKIVTAMGAKIQQGSFLPGIRQVQASGDFKVLEGRVGEQFVNQMPGTITEMYGTCNYAEDAEDKATNLDAYTLLYRSMRDKKKFSKYGEKFERFLKHMCQTSLDLFRKYADDDIAIPAIGRAEMVNIEELRNSDPLHYRIDVLPQTEDMESKLGQQLQIQSLLQYAGTQMTKQDLGRLMRNAPYGNKEQMFQDWTLDYDNATNDILALDRGQNPAIRTKDDHEYQVKRLEARCAMPDFPMMHPHIQQLYANKIQEHMQIMAEQAAAIQRGQSGFIPADGPLTPVDLYVQDPTSPKKTQRARLPLGALMWLTKKLEEQGVMQTALVQLSQGSQAELANLLPMIQQGAAGGGQGGGMPMTQPYLSQPGGAPQQP